MKVEELTDLIRTIASDEAKKKVQEEIASARQWGRDFDDDVRRKASKLDDEMKGNWPVVAAGILLGGIVGYAIKSFVG